MEGKQIETLKIEVTIRKTICREGKEYEIEEPMRFGTRAMIDMLPGYMKEDDFRELTIDTLGRMIEEIKCSRYK